MNCLEFRRIQLSDPHCRDAAFIAHRGGCAACAALAERALRFESELKSAMEVEVPPDLESRVLLANAFSAEARMPRRRLLAMAAGGAGVLVTGGIVGGLLTHSRAGFDLEQAVFAHIDEEPEALTYPTLVATADVAELMAKVGAELIGDPGHVTFANLCTIGVKSIAHLVVTGSRAPVSVLLMPERRVSDRTTLHRGDRQGVLLPIPDGSLAIVGRVGESLDVVEERIRGSLRLTI